MIESAFQSVLDWVGVIFAGAAVLRFLLQRSRVSRNNPLMEFATALSEFALHRLRPLIPLLRGSDVSPLVWAWLVDAVITAVQLTMSSLGSGITPSRFIPWVFAMATVMLLRQLLYVLMAAVFLLAVLSWASPMSPILPAVEALMIPFLTPLRKLVPPLGKIDFTPVVLMVIFQFTMTVGIGALETLTQKLM